eukprot:1602584-Rhodomonas_salina.1
MLEHARHGLVRCHRHLLCADPLPFQVAFHLDRHRVHLFPPALGPEPIQEPSFSLAAAFSIGAKQAETVDGTEHACVLERQCHLELQQQVVSRRA